jgi:hypothetical protein
MMPWRWCIFRAHINLAGSGFWLDLGRHRFLPG